MAAVTPALLFPETALSVEGVTDYIRTLLEQDEQLLQIWVAGEVSSTSQHGSGLFFTLQDRQATAALNCVVWRSQMGQLVAVPQPGEQVVVLGRIRVYGGRSQYQMVVFQCLPAGEGLRSLRYRQLRQRLEAEGVFAAERKRPLPAHPQVVAVVTSPQAAAWGDIQRTLKRRYPGLKLLLSPALVQGEQAPDSIVKAIQRVVSDRRAEVLILSRGGGATEDMACFNDERVVRAIAQCPIPVISGIGHQRDESLADLAADACAHTPTAAAAQAVPDLADLWHQHQGRGQHLQGVIAKRLDAEADRLRRCQQKLQPSLLDRQLGQERQALTGLKRRCLVQVQQRLAQAQQQQHSLQQTLEALDPQAVLRRGYAVVRATRGEIVRSVNQVQEGDRVEIQLQDGVVTAVIESK